MAISVNKVYRTVLSIINKEGRGFLTPDQFNRIGRKVQLDLLERAFFDYNKAINKEKANITNNGYANIPKNIKEKIDIFSKEAELLMYGVNGIKVSTNVRTRTTSTGVSIPTQVTAGTYIKLSYDFKRQWHRFNSYCCSHLNNFVVNNGYRTWFRLCCW